MYGNLTDAYKTADECSEEKLMENIGYWPRDSNHYLFLIFAAFLLIFCILFYLTINPWFSH